MENISILPYGYLKLYLFPFYLKGAHTHKDLPSAGSLPKRPQQLWLGQAKFKDLEHNLGLLCGWRDPSPLSRHLLLPMVCINRKLAREPRSQDSNEALGYEMWVSHMVT